MYSELKCPELICVGGHGDRQAAFIGRRNDEGVQAGITPLTGCAHTHQPDVTIVVNRKRMSQSPNRPVNETGCEARMVIC
jgi:hypothetical protein